MVHLVVHGGTLVDVAHLVHWYIWCTVTFGGFDILVLHKCNVYNLL